MGYSPYTVNREVSKEEAGEIGEDMEQERAALGDEESKPEMAHLKAIRSKRNQMFVQPIVRFFHYFVQFIS